MGSLLNKVLLKRVETGDEGTFGILTAPGLSLFTGELPWRDNAANVSCIPAGVYRCVWGYSSRFRRFMYGVTSVPSRSGVRIHSANFVGDASRGLQAQLNGCIALGEKLGWMNGQKCVLLSQPAVRKFEMLMNTGPFLLEVRNG